MIPPSSGLRRIVSSRALMSSFTDTASNELIYDSVIFPQINHDFISQHPEVSFFYICLAVSVVVMQDNIKKKRILHKWRNVESYQISKKQLKALLIFLFTFFIRNIQTVS
jgi:hypothetical protein